jgi:aminoglycoside phosphotransferase (APT) family kinase protein
VAAEWPDLVRHLTADNADIEHTLRSVRALVGGSVRIVSIEDALTGSGPPVDVPDAHLTADALEEMNRRLRDSLVHTIDVLDLPAGPDAPATLHEADRQIRELILRLLRREIEAAPAVPLRVNPTSGGGAVADSPQRVAEALSGFLAEQMPAADAIEIRDVQRMAGGASREAWLFEASWVAPNGPQTERCVMLRHPVSSVLESDESETKRTGSRRLAHTEFNLIRLMERQGIPVPHMLWVDPDGKWLDRPFSVSRLIAGTSDVTPLIGTDEAGPILDQYIEILGRLHNVDASAAGVDFLGTPTAATAALEQVELFEGGYHRQRLEEFPAISYMIRWLKKHQPVATRVSVIHGDFRLGNFMYDGGRILAMLDWEQAHVGDPLEEIAFMYWALWSLESVVPLTEFIARYEASSGIKVDHDTLAYYRVFIELKMCVVIMTGIKSYFATPERQLRYGGPATIEMLAASQLRVIEALDAGGPTIEFGQPSGATE